MKHRFIKIPSVTGEKLCNSFGLFCSSTAMSNDSNKAAVVHISLILLASGFVVSAAEMKTVDDFRAAAAKANAVLTIPDWEQTPQAVEAAMKNAIAKANASLDRIGA